MTVTLRLAVMMPATLVMVIFCPLRTPIMHFRQWLD